MFVNASYKTPVGAMTGFAYLIDQDRPYSMPSRARRTACRFAGSRAARRESRGDLPAWLRAPVRLGAQPNRFASSYYMGDLNLDFGGPQLGARYEVLGADKGVALTSFQTLLASLYKVQGWADQFLATSPNGIRDKQLTGGYLEEGGSFLRRACPGQLPLDG